MMMFLESAIAWTVWSISHTVAVPVISMGLPVPVDPVQNPPRMTLGRDLFMATHMM